jgi:hypothetical protein
MSSRSMIYTSSFTKIYSGLHKLIARYKDRGNCCLESLLLRYSLGKYPTVEKSNGQTTTTTQVKRHGSGLESNG